MPLKMKAPIGLLAFGLLTTLGRAIAALNQEGVKCGDSRCSTVEYCSRYDKHCKPCSTICDTTDRNYQPEECLSDCQEYLHDKRYVLLKQYDDLRGEVGRLWILVAVSTTAAVLSLLSSMFLIAKRFPRWEKMRATVARVFTGGRWIKRTNDGNDRCNRTARGTSSNNKNNNNNNSKALEDAELGQSKHNGLKLTMPTISASVAPERVTGNQSGSGASRSGSGSGSGASHATPNTTTTSLSGRHPSEDTTLDYAYDNPAMTPSPETVQLRPKRESSF